MIRRPPQKNGTGSGAKNENKEPSRKRRREELKNRRGAGVVITGSFAKRVVSLKAGSRVRIPFSPLFATLT